MDSESIYSLFPNRSSDKISRRLKKLYDAEYIERMDRDNVRLKQRNGSDHFTYALAREGGKALQAQGVPSFDPYRLKQKNRKLSPLALDHLIETSRFMVALERATWLQPGARLLNFDELGREIPKAQRRRTGLPLRLSASIDWHGTSTEQGTAPDEIFGLDLPDGRQYVFLEIDRGTETIAPSKRRQQSASFWHSSSILRKFLVYAYAFRQKAHQEQFGLPVFRVLTITTNSARVLQMQELYQAYFSSGPHQVTPGFFLFSDRETIGAHAGTLLDLPLTNGARKSVRLLR